MNARQGYRRTTTEQLLDAAIAHYERARTVADNCRHFGTAAETLRALAWQELWARCADRYFVACYGAYR